MNKCLGRLQNKSLILKLRNGNGLDKLVKEYGIKGGADELGVDPNDSSL